MILQDIINTLSLPEFYFAVFRSATPVLLTTLGAMIASRSGTNNIALEGTMLISAFVGVVVSAFTQSAWIGFFGAVLAGFLISNILAYFILKLNSNSVISGIALNTFASGGTIFALYLLTGEKGASTSLASLKLPSIDIPVIQDIPVIGAILSGHHVLTYAALILVAVIWYMFKYTELGMHIRAVGESPDAAESVGLHVKRVKYTALSLSGILTGMAGAFLSMGYVGLFSAGMTAGRGYIALATQAIAAGNAVIGMLASLLFGFCQSLANYLQSSGIPLQFIQMTTLQLDRLGQHRKHCRLPAAVTTHNRMHRASRERRIEPAQHPAGRPIVAKPAPCQGGGRPSVHFWEYSASTGTR